MMIVACIGVVAVLVAGFVLMRAKRRVADEVV
jgi:hypothetical protein